MEKLKAFAAGFVSTLVFHQGTLALLHAVGLTTRTAYAVAPTWPLHVPAFLSLAFWGGAWALALGYVVRRLAPRLRWIAWISLGALLPSLVAWFVVFPLKGLSLAPEAIALGLLLNGAWGLGVALFLELTHG